MAESKFKKRSGLGRGLGAILEDSKPAKETSPKKNKASSEDSTDIVNGISEVEISKIETNPWQPRTEFDEQALQDLSESIKVQGIIQPITVRKLNKNTYQLISGERRLQASKRAGLEKIPAYIRKADDQQMLEMAIIENIQRENLNAMEIAFSYQRLMDECSLKQEELGERVGKNRSTVTNYLRLLKLTPYVQAAVRDGKIGMGHAKALLGVEDIALQLNLLNQVLDNDLSVRKTEELVRSATQKVVAPKKEAYVNPEIKNLQVKLSSHFGTKIAVKANEENKGEIKIPFTDTDELNRILDLLHL